MSKKKHPEHVNHERWLVSYADFITLLFAFFVVLFASGQSDKRKSLKLAKAMQSAFTYNGIFDQHAKTPPLTDDPATAPAATPSPLMLPVPTVAGAEKLANTSSQAVQAQTQARIEGLVREQVTLHQMAASSVVLHATDDGLVVSLREAGFFDSGSAEVRPSSLGLLRAVAAIFPRQPMRVEGHTDNVPIHTAQFATNWELSTARAANITRLLISQNAVDPTQISAAGYAEFRPIANNSIEAGRQQNRRVDIVLLKAVPKPERSTDSGQGPSSPQLPAP
jgi:chemotaxis protein MotB